jgi:hypothetical protein
VQFIPFLGQVVQRKKKSRTKFPMEKKNWNHVLPKGAWLHLLRKLQCFRIFESFHNEWMFYSLFQIFVHCTILFFKVLSSIFLCIESDG